MLRTLGQLAGRALVYKGINSAFNYFTKGSKAQATQQVKSKWPRQVSRSRGTMRRRWRRYGRRRRFKRRRFSRGRRRTGYRRRGYSRRGGRKLKWLRRKTGFSRSCYTVTSSTRPSRPELKYFNGTIASTPVPLYSVAPTTANTWQWPYQIRIGTAFNQRVGNRIRLKSLDVHLYLEGETATQLDTVNLLLPHVHFIWMLVPDPSLVTVPPVLYAATYNTTDSFFITPTLSGAFVQNAFFNNTYAGNGQAKILVHKKLRARQIETGYTNLVPVANGINERLVSYMGRRVQMCLKFPKGLYCHFDADTGAITDVDSNLLIMYIYQDFHTGPGPDFSYLANWVMRYTDA